MTIFFAFLAGFYVGVFAISHILVVAGRRKEKEKETIHLLEQPGAANGPFLELAIKTSQVLRDMSLSVLINQKNISLKTAPR